MPARLVHFTLASDHVEDSVAFYQEAFGASFAGIDIGDDVIYRGEIAGLGMVICPATLASVVANRSRHQLQFQVDDVSAFVERSVASGGRIHTPLQDQNGRAYAVVCDPDNNTIEFTGAPEGRG